VLDRFRFIPIRLLQSIPVVFGVTIVVFFMVHLLPGNPALTILGQTATPERVAALNTQLGLDKPLWDQYFIFVGRLLHGDLGDSLTYQRPVFDLVAQAVPITLSLLAYALVLSLAISVPLVLNGWIMMLIAGAPVVLGWAWLPTLAAGLAVIFACRWSRDRSRPTSSC